MDDFGPVSPLAPTAPSFWQRVRDSFYTLARVSGLSRLFEESAPAEKSLAFTMAVIALGAKLAKADGRVTRSEVAAFRSVFIIPPEEEANAARVFDLARQDVAGFDIWAGRIARMFGENDPVLHDLMEGLFVIAAADGHFAPGEIAFLRETARIFAIPAPVFDALLARHDPKGCDPRDVLGLGPNDGLAEARARWHHLVKEAHPDQAIARGLPPEAIKLAEARVRALNDAWQKFQKMAQPS